MSMFYVPRRLRTETEDCRGTVDNEGVVYHGSA